MFSADDGVLIFIAYAAVVGEGFGEPVGGADDGCFCVDILGKFQVMLDFGTKVGKGTRTSTLCC